MKFILNKDKLKIDKAIVPNSGSINYYLADVEYDNSWNNLSIEAIIIKKDEQIGTAVAVINNQLYIDKKLKGRYFIGFVGYTIESDIKTYQISSDLKPIQFNQGAGEIEATNAEDVPSPSEWEIYMAQLQAFINTANGIVEGANNLDIDLEGSLLTITKKDGTTESVNTKGEKGDTGEDGYTPQKGVDYWTNADKTEVENDVIETVTPMIPDVSQFITKDVNNLTNYELKTETGHSIALDIDPYTYIITLSLKNSAGTILNTQTIDLPLETVVVGGSYDNVNKKIILTLKNGNTIDVPVGDLISGLQTEITSSNKLSSDLVDDTNSTNKFTTTTEKTAWNAKEDASNKVTSISSSSTDTQYPSAKCVYDIVGNIETLLGGI